MFAANAGRYLNELAKDFEEGLSQPQAVRRVEIPKAGGKTRPLVSNQSSLYIFLEEYGSIKLSRQGLARW
jgi:hypothetical protein